MKRRLITSVILFILLVVLGSCVPAGAPSPSVSPAPTTISPVPQAATQPSPVPGTEDPAWQKVEEVAKKEGRVLLYSSVFVGDAGTAIAKAFESKYGIKLEFITGSGTSQIERLRSEQAASKYIADTLDSGATLLQIAKRANILQPVGDLPEVGAKNVWRFSPRLDAEGFFINSGFNFVTMYVNTNIVKPGQEPKAWMDLLEPRWKGSLVIDTPLSQSTITRLYYMLAVQNKAIDKDFVEKLVKNESRIVPTSREVGGALVRGEAAIGIMADFVMNPLIKEGAPIKPVMPREGVFSSLYPVITLAQKAPHPNAARLFINWFLGQEGQTIYGRAKGVAPFRTDVPDFTPEQGKLELSKVFYATVESEEEVDRLMASGTIASIFGLKK